MVHTAVGEGKKNKRVENTSEANRADDIQLLLQILKRLIPKVSEQSDPYAHRICLPSPKILTLREVRRSFPAEMIFAEVLPQ